MKIWVITKGEDYAVQDIVCAKQNVDDAVQAAKELAEKDNAEKLERGFTDYLYEMKSNFHWHTGVDSIDVIETELT